MIPRSFRSWPGYLLALGLCLCLVAAETAHAAGEAGPPAAAAAEKTGQSGEFDMHAPYVRYHFSDPDMDFTFGSMALGSTVNHGCEIGEAFYAAANIKDGDAASWQEQWHAAAGRAEARGRASLAGGHVASARDQLSRAANYYRLSLLAMLPDDPRLPERAARSRALMKEAGALFEPPLMYFEVPFEDGVLPGYFRAAGPGSGPRKTLVMLGGGETFAEDLVFYIMPQAHARGYNFVTVDLPGQGLMPLANMMFRPDMYVPVKALLDAVLKRPEVDPKRLAVYGISGGGGFAPQTAQHDPRVKAVAMNGCVVDAHSLFAAMDPVTSATPEKVASWSSFHANTVKGVAWRWGVPLDNIPGLVEANRGFAFDPSKVAIPALIMIGEGEFGNPEVKRQQELCFKGLANPEKKLVVLPLDEGASSHCAMENRSLMGQVLFDWLDGALK